MARFSDEEIRRYARQMVLPEVGGVGQLRLREASATATGEMEALYLAGAGVGRLTVPTEEIAARVHELNPLVSVVVAPGSASVEAVEIQALRALAVLREALGL